MFLRGAATFAVTLTAGAVLVLALAERQNPKTKTEPSRQPLPYWAFAVNPPGDGNEAEPDHTQVLHVPGSAAAFTAAQTHDLFAPPDWHPDGHPSMPEIVARGRKPDVYACGYCHLPNGQGRPENSSLAGLPAAYITQQMADFKTGLRKSSEPRSLPVANMISHETLANEDEVRQAADYFSKLKTRRWIRVVENR